MMNRGGGAIFAALYLSEFLRKSSKVGESKAEGNSSDPSYTQQASSRDSNSAKSHVWFHMDFMGSKNGIAEPQGMRAIYEYIKRELVKN